MDVWARRRGAQLTVAHVDHGLRGAASRADAAFVRREAARRGRPVVLSRVPVAAWARRHRRGIEESSRILRYRALAVLARRAGATAVATGHTLDDQVETIFLHLLRGAGPGGLGGMSPAGPWPIPGGHGLTLVRPLLEASKAELRRRLRRRGLSFRRDATNRDTRFLRNRLRPVLAAWERWGPGFARRMSRLAAVVRDEEDYWRRRLSPAPGEPAAIDRRKFMRYHAAEQRRWLRLRLGLGDAASIERARDFARRPTGGVSLPGGLWGLRDGRLVFVTGPRRSPPRAGPARPLLVPGTTVVSVGGADWTIRARFVRRRPAASTDPRRAYVDADRLTRTPPRVRSWRPGDRFQPLGLAGRKKLQDFFVDEKVPPDERPRTPLVENADGILWLAGRRLADVAKVTPATRRIVELTVRRRELPSSRRVLRKNDISPRGRP
jgi:tRNA(Ile)-lysidine synthase